MHDELDIPFDTVRLKQGGGHGGHNGVRDVSKATDAGDFTRVRVGIGRPPGRQDAADFVLKDFSGTERQALPNLLSDAADAVEAIVERRPRRRAAAVPLARLSGAADGRAAQIRPRRNSSGETPSARARCTRRSCSSVESSSGERVPRRRRRSSSAKSAVVGCRVESRHRARIDDRHGRVELELRRRPRRSTGSPSATRGDGAPSPVQPGPRGHLAAAPVRLGDRACPGVGRLVQLVPDVAPHPLESVAATGERLVELLEQLDVHDGLAVGLAPALALPPGHPLRDRVDHVLAVAEHEQLVVEVRGRAEELEHGRQLGLVVRGVRPAAGRPAVVVDVPGPARGAGVSESRSVGGGGDHGGPFGEVGLIVSGAHVPRRSRLRRAARRASAQADGGRVGGRA